MFDNMLYKTFVRLLCIYLAYSIHIHIYISVPTRFNLYLIHSPEREMTLLLVFCCIIIHATIL